MNLSGATVNFTAWHFDPIMDEGWHEHTWKVTVWWPMEPFRDGRSVREAAREVIDDFLVTDEDGSRYFPKGAWSNEDVAKRLVVLGNIVKITVDRPGFHTELWV